MTVEQLQAELDRLDKGLLQSGSHKPGREFCALEFESQVRGREWSDEPITLPDLRPLNDASWTSAESRTKNLLLVMSALWDWSNWTTVRRTAWVNEVVIETVKQIISGLPLLPIEIVEQCKQVRTVNAASAASAAANAAYAASAATCAAAYA